MKILRWLAILLLFILAVFLARENDALIDLVYYPGVPLTGFDEPRSVTIPLFLLVLVTLGAGGILGGGLALFQQARLKLKLRRYETDRSRLTNDVAAVREKLGLVTAQLDEARREAAELRSALDEAGADPAIEPDEPYADVVAEPPGTGGSLEPGVSGDADRQVRKSPEPTFDPAAEPESTEVTAEGQDRERTEESS